MSFKRSMQVCLLASACLLALVPWGCSKKSSTNPNQAPSIDGLLIDGASLTTDSLSVQSSVAAIQVQASDDEAVDRVLINNHAATLSGSSWSWTSQLAAGSNRFIIEVWDEDNLSDIDTIYLNYLSDYPNLFISNFVHSNIDTVQSATFSLSGSIKDVDGIEYVKVNNSSATLNDTSWTWSTTLNAGSNLLIISAKDSSGLEITPESLWVYFNQVVPSGLAKISGVLTQAGTGTNAKRLASAKMATNAAGQVMARVTEVIPVTGADILVYDADTTSTASVARTQTNASGLWEIDSLEPGNYFIFAVYFDVINRSLITAAIPNVEAKADSQVSTGEAIAAEDEVKPSVLTMIDAASPDSTGLFLASSVPEGKPILSIAFTEPMDRPSAKDSVMGIVLGPIDTSVSTFKLADTIAVLKLWNGNNTELRLIPTTDLEANKTYGILVPTTVKDMAFNVLESKAMVTFTTIEAAQLAPFIFAGSSPASGDTVLPTAPLTFNFSRPADLLSVSKLATIDPVVRGYCEARGTSISFKPEAPLASGSYTIRIPSKITSLLGDTLQSAATITFHVKAFSGLAASGGDTATLSQGVMTCMNAYMAGDIATFASYMDAGLLVVDQWEGGDGRKEISIKTKEEFISGMKGEAAQNKLLASEGAMFPKYFARRMFMHDRNDSGWQLLYKVRARGDTSKYVFVDPHSMGPFGGPQFFNAQKTEIQRDSIRFVPPGPLMEYAGKQYAFGPDYSKLGTVTEDQIRKDLVFYGKLLMETSTIDLARVRMQRKEQFDIESVEIQGDTGYVVQSVVQQRIWMGDSRPWPYIPGVNLGMGGEPDTSSDLMAIKLMCIKKSGRWLISRITTTQIARVNGLMSSLPDSSGSARFELDPATAFELPPFVGLISPINKADSAAASDGSITLKWNKPDVDSAIGGYLVCLAEEPAFAPCRPPKGVMIFAKGANDTVITVKANGTIDTAGGSKNVAIYKRPHEIGANMFPWFDWKLDRIESHMVLRWSVLAIKDTSAAQLLSNSGWARTIWAQSDFGIAKGYFAAGAFPSFEQVDSLCAAQGPQNQQPVGGGFEDMDRDGYPDDLEIRYGTNPRDPASTPSFEIDSDGDKYPDFIEIRCGTDAKNASSKPSQDSLNVLGWKDSDGDGFPDEIEAQKGFNMFDPNNNPGARVAFEAPIGSFAGKVYYGSAKALTVRVSKDTAGDEKAYSVIYSLVQDVGDTLAGTGKAFFDPYMGMFVFLLPFEADGPNAGKSMRMRGNYDGMMGRLQGPVEIVNTTTDLNMIGPMVANWVTSNRGEEFGDEAPPMNQPGPGGPSGTPIAPPNADSAYLIIAEESGQVLGKLVYLSNPLDTMESIKAFKSGTLEKPFLEIAFQSGNQVIKLRGDVFPADRDSLGNVKLGYFGGVGVEDSMGMMLPYGGGMGFMKADEQRAQLAGTYLGWVFIDQSMSGNTGGMNFGAPEYTGGYQSLVNQLQDFYTRNGLQASDTLFVKDAISGNMCFAVNWADKLIPVDSMPQYGMLHRGCVFIVANVYLTSLPPETLLVFGAPDRMQIAMQMGFDNRPVLTAGTPPPAGGTPGPVPQPSEPILFKGEISLAQNALNQYHAARVMNQDGSSFDVPSVAGGTFLALSDPERGPMVIVQFTGNNVWYAVLSKEPAGLTVWVENDRIFVAQMPSGFQPPQQQ